MTAVHADWFGTTTIDHLERIESAVYMMTAGIGAALMRAAWRVETSPGRPLELTNGSARVNPRDVISRLVEDVNALKEWRETCDAHGITGLQLRPSEDAAPATT